LAIPGQFARADVEVHRPQCGHKGEEFTSLTSGEGVVVRAIADAGARRGAMVSARATIDEFSEAFHARQ
jgi:hypothetical protein